MGPAQCGPRPWAHSGEWGSCAGLGDVNITQVQGEAVLGSTATGAGPRMIEASMWTAGHPPVSESQGAGG